MKNLTGTLRHAEDIHLVSLSNLQGEYATVISTADLLAPMHTAFRRGR